MESIVAGVLRQHWAYSTDTRTDPFIDRCLCGVTLRTWGDDNSPIEKLAAHQAVAVMAALQEAGTVEWGVRWPYLSEMYPERTDTKESQEAAQASIDKSFADGALVSRLTLPWQEVEA